MSKDSFHDVFRTGSQPVAVHRKTSRGGAAPSYDPEDQEGFYGQFSTATPDDEPGKVYSWVLENRDSSVLQLVILLVVAFNLVFGVVRPFVAEPMRIPSKSMTPTLQVHDRILTNKLAYDFFSSPERGDLAVFESVTPKDDKRLVKRVVGLPGDEVSVENGVLLVNGQPPYEPYRKDDPTPEEAPPNTRSFGPATVPEGHVFVMGDNRANSYDSRFFGPVPEKNLVGKVVLLLWPLDRFGTTLDQEHYRPGEQR